MSSISGVPAPLSPTYTTEYLLPSNDPAVTIKKVRFPTSSELARDVAAAHARTSTNPRGESQNTISTTGSSILNGLNSGFDLAKSYVRQSDYKADQITGQALNTIGDAAMTINPLIGTALKGLSFVTTSIGPTVKGTKANDYVDTSSSYGGADSLETKKFGLFGSIFGGASRYRDKVAKRNQERYAAAGILRSAQEDLLASNSSSIADTYNNMLRGGYQQTNKTTFGKEGLKLDLSFAHRVLNHLNKKGSVISEFKSGGKMNIIPDGALHARKHEIDDPELNGNITAKGIPVIKREGGSVDQIAEIEINEIIFSLETTNKLEKLRDKGDDEAAIEAGKILVEEILYNTKDYTGLIDKVN